MKPEMETSLREEFDRLHGEAEAVIERATSEQREVAADEKSANERRFTRMKQITDTFEQDRRREELQFARRAIMGEDVGGHVTRPQDPPGRAEFERNAGLDRFATMDKDARTQFSRALDQWAATGEMDRRFAAITTATGSGILLPKTVLPPIEAATPNTFREAMELVGVRPVETTGTGALTLPVLDTDAGGVVAENASSETENEPDVGGIVLNVQTYQSGSAWFSNQQLQAVDFDLSRYVTGELTYAKEIGLEAAIAAALIADAGITQVVTTATLAGFTYANLVDLNRALPKKYDRLKVIVLSREAYAAAEKLVGSDGHPVLNKDPQNQWLMRFNGTPVVRSDYLEAFGANKVVGVLVSFIGFKIRDVTTANLARYTNIPAKPNQTGFNLFAYHAFGWVDAACAKLKTPAS